MGRYVFIPPPFRQAQSANGDPNNRERHNVKQWRDHFRNGDGNAFTDLNVPLASPRWKVSDIIEMGTGVLEMMYAFLVRDTTNNIEYLFVFAGRDSTISPSEIGDFIAWDGADIQRVSSNPNLPYGSTDTYTMAVFINIDYTASSWGRNWGFDDAVEMTFTGGDFEDVTLTSDPSNASTFDNDWKPTGVLNPRGIYFTNSALDNNIMHAIVFDDVEDAVAVYRTGNKGEFWVENVAVLSKNLFTANTVGDTNLQGAAWFTIDPTTTNFGSILLSWADGFDNLGNPVDDFDLVTDDNFTPENERVGGLAKWRSVVATSVSFDKGWLNSNLIVEIGAFNSYTSHRARYAQPNQSNPCVKLSNAMAFPWAPGVPAFPFGFDGLIIAPVEP